jgi:hypothetical protein
MSPTAPGRFPILSASLMYLLLWIPALLVAALVTLASIPVFASAPILSAVSFVLALPAVLVGVKSFRVSAIALTILLVWDVLTTSWPHISLAGFLGSQVDVLLLIATVLVVLVASSSPFVSVIAFVRQVWHSWNR